MLDNHFACWHNPPMAGRWGTGGPEDKECLPSRPSVSDTPFCGPSHPAYPRAGTAVTTALWWLPTVDLMGHPIGLFQQRARFLPGLLEGTV